MNCNYHLLDYFDIIARGGAILAATGCSSNPSPAADVHPSPGAPQLDTIQWSPCGIREQPLDCGEVAVPLDYANPSLGNVHIAITRSAARLPASRLGVLIVDPGGPGASSQLFVQTTPQRWRANETFAPLLDHFDIIGVDRRGTGFSVPTLNCYNDLTSHFVIDPEASSVTNGPLRAQFGEEVRAGCASRSGNILHYLSTERAARDLDSVRNALGEKKLNFLVYSYGTFLAATYIDLYPDHVRAAVFDSPVDMSLSGDDIVMQQALGLEKALDELAEACPADQPVERLAALQHYIQHSPLKVSDTMSMFGQPHRSLAYVGILEKLRRSQFAGLCALFRERGLSDEAMVDHLINDNYRTLIYLGIPQNFVQTRTTIMVADGFLPRDISAYDRVLGAAPRVGVTLVAENITSALWPTLTERKPVPFTPKGAAAKLVVASTNDRYTPFEWGKSLAKQIGAWMITYSTRNHALVGSQRINPDINRAVTKFLIAPPEHNPADLTF